MKLQGLGCGRYGMFTFALLVCKHLQICAFRGAKRSTRPGQYLHEPPGNGTALDRFVQPGFYKTRPPLTIWSVFARVTGKRNAGPVWTVCAALFL